MSEHRPVTDADLVAQLRRRSTRAGVASELPVRDFVAAVGTKIDAGATIPVGTRRWPTFAGLAGAAAILLVLVVALPRLGPGGPSPSPGLLGAPPSTISTMPVREFAARVAAGELRGETVLVNAAIVPASGDVYADRCNPPGPCLMGVLATGVGVSPGVFANYVADIDEGDPSKWSLSYLPEAPQTGVMVLSVDQQGRIIFGGRNPPDVIATLMSEIPSVDFDATPLEEIRVVPAWLTGIVAPFSCAPPDPGTYIADLPGRYCGGPSWLAGTPLRVDPHGYTIPDDALEVQSNAYLDFAPEPAGANGSAEPRAGLYVIAKRLEGSGCPENAPPCWQWEIVGRVTINGEATQAGPIATPTPAAVREIECGRGPEGVSSAFPGPTIVDEIGIVDSCEVFEPQPGQPFPDPIAVRNSEGDDNVLEVHWSGTPCDIATRFTLRLVAQRAHFDGIPPERECEASLIAHHMRVVLTQPLLAETITAFLSGRNTGVSATPTPAPPTGVRFECVGPPLPPEEPPYEGPLPVVIDETGLVESCLQTDSIEELSGTISVSNPFEPNAIEVVWAHGMCDGAIEFTFRAADDGYELAGERPTACTQSLGPLPVYIRFSRPMPAESVTASITDLAPPPSPTPAPPGVVPTPNVPAPPAGVLIECAQPKAEIGAVVIDAAGLVDSCVTVEATGEGVAEDPVVRNPNGMLTELQIEWPGSPCDAAVGYTLVPGATGLSIEIGPRPDGKRLSSEIGDEFVCIAKGVIHAIRLHLSSGVDARNVWISRTAVPTTSIRTIRCDDSEVALKDSTGLVVSCRATAVDQEPADSNPLITNPDGDSSRLHMFWAFQDPSACGPEPPSLALDFRRRTVAPGFVVSTAADFVPGTGCFHVARWFGLEIVLSEPVPSADIAFATVGNGTIATAKTAVGIFDLVITAEDVEYSSGESIQIYAALHYNGGDDGGDPSVELSGAGSLVNGFGIKQLDGPLVMGPGWDEPCIRHQLPRSELLVVEYEKSAAWSDDDPNAGFYRDWVRDDELRLPSGTWLVTAYSEFAIGSDCAGPLVSLQASRVIVVR